MHSTALAAKEVDTNSNIPRGVIANVDLWIGMSIIEGAIEENMAYHDDLPTELAVGGYYSVRAISKLLDKVL